MVTSLKFLLAGFVIGVVAWSFSSLLLPVVLLLFLLWPRCESRLSAFVLWLGFYLGTVNGLPIGALQFFDAPAHVSLPLGLLFWLSHAAILALPWVIFPASFRLGWVQNAGRFMLALAVSILPPVGLLGWGHPVAVSGILFPGMEWIGLGLGVILMFMLMQWHNRSIRGFSVLLLAGAVIANLIYQSPAIPDGWQTLDTRLGKPPVGPISAYQRHMELQERADATLRKGASVVLLPENITGKWSELELRLWQNWLRHSGYQEQSVILSGHEEAGAGRYHNSMIAVSAKSLTAYHARLSMPVGNYNPFSARSVTIAPGGDGILAVAGKRVALFVCYESVVTWPYLLSMKQRPDLLAVATNVWWAADTSLPKAMRIYAVSWTRLFGLPLLYAENQ